MKTFMKSLLPKTARACLLALGVMALWNGTAGAQTITISNLFSISTTNGRPYLTNSAVGTYTERGAAYNPVNNHAYIVSRAGTLRVGIIDGDTGADIGLLNVTGISGGTFALSTIAVAADGAIYAANLTTGSATSPYKIYRWADESSAPTVAYSGNPLSPGTETWRFGESFDVRGSGVDTEIITSAGIPLTIPTGTNVVAVFKTVDGTNFTSTRIDVSGLGARNDLARGISFGPTNTFYGRNNGGGGVRFCRYDLGAGTATVLSSFTGLPPGLFTIDVDPINNLMAAVESTNAISPHTIRVYDISGGSAVQLFQTNFPSPGAANGNVVGEVQMLGGHIFGIAAQNGVVMLGYSVNTNPAPPSVTQQPPNTTIVEGGYGTITAGAGGAKPLFYQWFQGATPIPGANTNFLTLTNVTLASAGSYSVVVSNSVGTTSSAPAVLTITPTALTPVMTKLWQQTPGSTFYLANDNNHRGLAYNPLNNHVIVVSRTPTNGVHVLDGTTGAYLHSLDLTGIAGGTFLINMVACTEAGEVYVGNLTTGGTGSAFKLYYWSSDAPTTASENIYSGDPGSGDNQRWGDNLDVRLNEGGAAEILAGSRNGKLIAKFEHIPGFPASVSTNLVPDAENGNFGLSCVWGEGNTIWGKSSGLALRQIEPDFLTGVGTVVKTITGVLGVNVVGADRANKRLAAINTGETPANVRLLSVDGNSLEVDTEFFPTDNANSNGTGAARFGNGRLVVLDSNNGIMMLRVAPKLRWSQSGSNITFTWDNGLDGPFRLQSSFTLSPGAWTDVSGGGTSGVIVPVATSGNLFFRLTN
jgi:Domain of unknown function (DUF4623)